MLNVKSRRDDGATVDIPQLMTLVLPTGATALWLKTVSEVSVPPDDCVAPLVRGQRNNFTVE